MVSLFKALETRMHRFKIKDYAVYEITIFLLSAILIKTLPSIVSLARGWYIIPAILGLGYLFNRIK